MMGTTPQRLATSQKSASPILSALRSTSNARPASCMLLPGGGLKAFFLPLVKSRCACSCMS